MVKPLLFFFTFNDLLYGSNAVNTEFNASNSTIFDVYGARAEKLAWMMKFEFKFKNHFTRSWYNYMGDMLRTEACAKPSRWCEADNTIWF